MAAPSGLSIWLIQGWPHIAYYLVNSTYLANSMHVDVLVRVGANLYKAFLACFVASTSKNGDDAANNAATESGHGTVTNETLHSSKTCCLSLSTYSARRSQGTNPVREANGRHGDAVLDAFAARASSREADSLQAPAGRFGDASSDVLEANVRVRDALENEIGCL